MSILWGIVIGFVAFLVVAVTWEIYAGWRDDQEFPSLYDEEDY